MKGLRRQNAQRKLPPLNASGRQNAQQKLPPLKASGRKNAQQKLPPLNASGRKNVQSPSSPLTPQPPSAQKPSLRRQNAQRKLVTSNPLDDRNTIPAMLRDLVNHEDLRESLLNSEKQDNRSFWGKIPHAVAKALGEQLNVLREDPVNAATSTALGSTPVVRTALHGNRLNRSAIKASEYLKSAQRLGTNSPLGGLAQGVQRHAENETRNDLINYTTSAVRDALDFGGVTGLAGPAVGLAGAGLKAVNGLVVAARDQGDISRNAFRAKPSPLTLARAIADSPDLANNANRAISDAIKNNVEPTPPLPFDKNRPTTPLAVRAARVAAAAPGSFRELARNLGEAGKSERRAQQDYRTRQGQRRARLPLIGSGK